MFNIFFGGVGGGKGRNAVNGLMWENMVEPDRPQMTIYYGSEKMQSPSRFDPRIVQLLV